MPGRGSHMATICQGWVLVAKWAGHLLSTPPADPCPSCLGWAAECVAETKVLCRRCPLGTQPRVRWGAGEGPHRRQPLSSLAAPRNGSQQGLNTHLVKGRRKREGELGLSRSTHSELINPLQEAAWCRSQEKLGLHKLWLCHIQLCRLGSLFHLLGLQLPLHKMGIIILKERCCEQNGEQSVNSH